MGDVPLSLEICGNSELDYDYVVACVGKNMGNCIYLLLFRCKLDVNSGMNMIYVYIYVPNSLSYMICKRCGSISNGIVMHVFLL